ncbi:hypothetical protein [Granulicoccus sp. GXG6511]|uniref:hypothetical protein n=1 Tax=Granulicoccus sp. GXG6511 TaxID=3381351 RepID=UPI003D7DCE99
MTITMQNELTFTVCLFRGTNDVDSMVDFLQALGMGPVLFNEHDPDLTYVYAKGGVVALYENPDRGRPGRAELSFCTNDYNAAADLFESYDLNFERSEVGAPGVTVTDTNGQAIWVGQAVLDRTEAQKAANPVEIVALRHSLSVAGDSEFFEVLGFSLQQDGQVDWRVLSSEAPAGVIGLAPGNLMACSDGQAEVQIGFVTTEPLDQVAARLKTLGHHVGDVFHEADTPFFTVTDPDGVTAGVFAKHRP